MHCDKELRFWAKVQKGAHNECWVWTGAKRGSRQKRGCFWDGSRNVDAARWIWQRTKRVQLQPGQVVMHRCDNPLCVNPKHLRVGSQGDNVADMWAKGRANLDAIRTGAAKGRATLESNPERRQRGERHWCYGKGLPGQANGNASLSDEAVREIRALAGTMSQRKIAEQYGVHQAVIWRVINRKGWAHVE